MFDNTVDDLFGDDPSKYKTFWELYGVLLIFGEDPGELLKRKALAYARWLYGEDWVREHLERGGRPLAP